MLKIEENDITAQKYLLLIAGRKVDEEKLKEKQATNYQIFEKEKEYDYIGKKRYKYN